MVQIVDRSGNVVNNYKNDEWGNILSKNETISNPFKYSGEILDDETGLYYLRARYYEPTIGRFLNEDSVEGTVTNPLTLNVYSYVNNNPMMYVDPTGNISWRQYTTLFGGILDGLTGFSGLKSLFSWSTIQGLVQFGNAIIHGQLNYFVDVVKSVGASFVEPFQYLAEHSKNVWAGKPTDQEVAQYGRSMGSVIQTIVGAVGGGGILGEKIVAQLGKICPKLMKVVDKVAEGVSEAEGGIVKGLCFTGDTPVMTESGHKKIQDLKVGDKVYAENVETGEKGYKAVKQIFVNDAYELIHINVKDTEIKTTFPHPFYVVGKGWVAAKDLVVGDLLKLVNGETTKVKGLKVEELENPVKVYNFEVEDWHTYFVSNYDILVHNTGSNPCAATAVHGNSLKTTKPAVGYSLKNKDTDAVLKYGETNPNYRYSKKFLEDNNAFMDIETNGTKAEMHDWQHEQILDYKDNSGGVRPPWNKSDW